MLSQTCLLAENILYDHKETIITSTQSILNCLWHLGSYIKWCNDLSCPIRYLKIAGSSEINGLSYTCPKPCIIRHYFLLVKISPCGSWKNDVLCTSWLLPLQSLHAWQKWTGIFWVDMLRSIVLQARAGVWNMAYVMATTRLIKLYCSENNHLHIFNIADRKMDFQQKTELILLIIPFFS